MTASTKGNAMLAYHNDKSLKAKTVKAMKADIAAERLQPGHYWNGKNGCFVGCVIRGNEHSKFEDVLGIPRILARIGDRLYEGLGTTKEKQQFAVDFLDVIIPGADLTVILPKFIHFVLVDKKHGVINFANKDKTKKSIQDVADMYARKIAGEKIDANEWLKLRKAAAADAAAYAAAAAVAYAAAAAVAYAAAADAADAAAYAAADAADAAAYAAAADAAARSRHYAALAAYLIKLLGDAKPSKIRKAALALPAFYRKD